MSGHAGRFLKRIFGDKPDGAVAATAMVDVGDRFYQVGMGSAIWVVERICDTPNCDILHVVIRRGGSFPDTKIISVNTLTDTSLYRRDRRQLEQMNETKYRRRKDDPPIKH